MISVLCGCLVLISQYQNLLNKKLLLQEELIDRNNSAFNKYLNNLRLLDYEKTEEIDLFEDGILSYISKKNWGFYDVLISKTVFQKDTLYKIALIGKISDEQNPLALYVTDYGKALKLSGKVEISGQMKVPVGRTEQAYVNGPTGNSIQIEGQQQISEDRLPKIDQSIDIDISKYRQIQLEQVKNNSIINNFDKETIVLNINGVSNLNNITCKGNIIITSNTTLTISNSANLNDVLIIAPEIVLQSGFNGNVQVIANKVVEIEEDVNLRYPSSIYIKNDIDSVSIKIKKNSTLIGGIVIDGDTYTGSLKRKLIIEENAKVIGTLYNYGRTQLKGNIIGSLYSDRMFLKTNSSDYENVILNATINRDDLPKDFVEIPLFKNITNQYNYGIIKEF